MLVLAALVLGLWVFVNGPEAVWPGLVFLTLGVVIGAAGGLEVARMGFTSERRVYRAKEG